MGGAGRRHQHQRPAGGGEAQAEIVVLVVEEDGGVEAAHPPQRRHPHQQQRPREIPGAQRPLGREIRVQAPASGHALKEAEVVGEFDVAIGSDDGRAEQAGVRPDVGGGHQLGQRGAVDGGIGADQEGELGLHPLETLVAAGAEAAVDAVADQGGGGQEAGGDGQGVVVAGVVDQDHPCRQRHRGQAGADHPAAVVADGDDRDPRPGTGLTRLRVVHAPPVPPLHESPCRSRRRCDQVSVHGEAAGGGREMGIKRRKPAKTGRRGGDGGAFERALAAHQAGDLAAAEALYRQVLAGDPRHDGALHYLGSLACQCGQWEAAAALIGEAVAIRPDQADARNNLGTALWRQGKAAAAAAEFAEALALKPAYPEALNNLANVLKDQGRVAEAEARYRRALALKPDYPEALNNLGSVVQGRGRPAEALELYQRALALKPDYPEAHNNAGNALLRLGRAGEAEAHYRRALALKPDYAEAHNNLGGVLVHQGRPGEGEACFARALAVKSDFAVAHNNLGGALQQQGRMDEAAACFERALALKPDHEEAHRNLVYGQLYRPGVTLAGMLDAARDWSAVHADHLAAARPPAVPVSAADRPPRLGFVSGDFREHVVGRLAVPALEALARAGQELVCYSNHPLEDALTARFRAAAAAWRPIHGLGDAEAAALTAADGIDILFDLSGYTADSRLLLFARKPVPLQVTWLGYPATTGLAAMDYLLADPVQVPPEADIHYQEKVIRLPASYLLYRPPVDAPEPGARAVTAGAVTFGSFNGVPKLAPPVIALWSRLLHRLPAARLRLKAPAFTDEAVRRRYRALFAGHGIADDRLDFIGRTSPADHLRAMGEVDIALDSFPYTGGATTVDTLWMGTPVVALIGETLAHRHSAGYLTAVGLTDLIASTPERYLDLAADLAEDPARLQALRAGLRSRMAASPLCDEAAFVRAFIAACAVIHNRHLAGEPPRSLEVGTELQEGAPDEADPSGPGSEEFPARPSPIGPERVASQITACIGGS